MGTYSLENTEGNSDLRPRAEGKSMTILPLLLKCKLGLRLWGSEPSVTISGSASHGRCLCLRDLFSFLGSLKEVVALDSFGIG